MELPLIRLRVTRHRRSYMQRPNPEIHRDLRVRLAVVLFLFADHAGDASTFA